MLDSMKLGTRRSNFQRRFLQWTTAFELFYSTSVYFRFLVVGKQKKNSAKKRYDVHRDQTYLTASHAPVALFL